MALLFLPVLGTVMTACEDGESRANLRSRAAFLIPFVQPRRRHVSYGRVRPDGAAVRNVRAQHAAALLGVSYLLT